jgi:hypothetical protein
MACGFGGVRRQDERAEQVGGGWPMEEARRAGQFAAATGEAPVGVLRAEMASTLTGVVHTERHGRGGGGGGRVEAVKAGIGRVGGGGRRRGAARSGCRRNSGQERILRDAKVNEPRKEITNGR